MNSSIQISKTIGVALLATTVVVATGAALVLAVDFVLLIFLAILFGVFLTKTSGLLDEKFSIGYGKSLGAITTTLVVLAIGSIIVFGVNIEQQLGETSAQLDKSSRKLSRWMEEHPLLGNTIRKIPFASDFVLMPVDSPSGNAPLANYLQEKSASQNPSNKSSVKGTESKTGSSEHVNPANRQQNQPERAASDSEAGSFGNADSSSDKQEKTDEEKTDEEKTDAASSDSDGGGGESDIVKAAAGKVFAAFGQLLSTTLGAATNIIIVFFMGVFIAVDPTLYRDGVVWLFPQDKRNRTTEVMNKVGESMFKWLNGRFLAMFITGAGTAIVLMFLGVPMPITVGVITGLLAFIPNIGGLIALVIAALLALTVSPMTVLWVVIAYGVLQLIESNVVTPIVQQHQTSVPPALLIGFQILMGALTGFLGVMVATPLLAAGMVVVKELWIKDTLNDDSFDDQEQSDANEDTPRD